MLHIISTLDYEIHGNGEGSPQRLMVKPTARALSQFAHYGAPMTIMADVAEILRFRAHFLDTGRDDFAYAAIAEQLRLALLDDHDVQLHLHPSYLNARLVGRAWAQDYAEYDVAALSPQRLLSILGAGKQWLEELLQPVDPSYRCLAFRAANWSMQPSEAITHALVASGIKIDTSVFKYGQRNGIVRFDYRHAHHPLGPWPVAHDDICRRDSRGELLEFPIACESRRLHHFFSLNRINRALQDRLHPIGGQGRPASRERHAASRMRSSLARLCGAHAWKLDFNQCSGPQLIRAVERAAKRHDRQGQVTPVVLIGHSKLFNVFNARSLDPFLQHVASHPERYRFDTFAGTLKALEASRTSATSN